MNRAEAIEALEELARELEGDIAQAQTRGLHIALSQRLARTRRIISELSAGPVPNAAE